MAACHYCGEPKAKTEDHIVPKALGGTDAYINRVAACRRCNEAKAADMPTCSCGTCRYAVMYWEARQEGLSADWMHSPNMRGSKRGGSQKRRRLKKRRKK